MNLSVFALTLIFAYGCHGQRIEGSESGKAANVKPSIAFERGKVCGLRLKALGTPIFVVKHGKIDIHGDDSFASLFKFPEDYKEMKMPKWILNLANYPYVDELSASVWSDTHREDFVKGAIQGLSEAIDEDHRLNILGYTAGWFAEDTKLSTKRHLLRRAPQTSAELEAAIRDFTLYKVYPHDFQTFFGSILKRDAEGALQSFHKGFLNGQNVRRMLSPARFDEQLKGELQGADNP